MVRWLPSFRPKPRPAAAAAKPAPSSAAPAIAPVAAHPGGYHIESYSRTHEGRVRTHNEDSYVARDDGGLWAVADGMGGHEGGEWASGKLAEKLGAIDVPDDLEEASASVEEAIRAANRAILVEAGHRGRQMGTTLVALLVKGDRYRVLWVGDSRAYRLRDGEFTQLSRDHTQVQEMVDRGLMEPAQLVGHPMSHILSRAVGARETFEIDHVDGEVEPGDVFLLCSDGLHGYVGKDVIRRLLGRGSPERALDELIALTLEAGAPDNVTGIAVWASDPTLLSFGQTGQS
jgi:serine/threonine protein phosphatase PrpC